MVCLDDGVTCVPNHSRTGDTICLPGSVRCDGIDDCLGGKDEEDCPAYLPGGIQALIALVVIGVIILIPVIYVIIRRRQGKPVLPAVLRPMVDRITPCCRHTKGEDRSSRELTNVSNQSDKDGFTNGAFDSSATGAGAISQHSPPQNQQYSVTGKPLNKFKQAVNSSELERSSSYRDWQANRLQQPPGGKASPKIPNGAANQHQTDRGRGYGQDRMQTQAVIHKGPITYEQPSNRAESQPANQPYAIASPDGKSKYEARTHLRDYQPTNKPVGEQPPWQRTAEPDLPPTYDNYMYASNAVPPTQLREALERVAANSPYDTGYSSRAGQGSPRYNTQHSPQTRTDQVSPRYGGRTDQISPRYGGAQSGRGYQISPRQHSGYRPAPTGNYDPSDDTVV